MTIKNIIAVCFALSLLTCACNNKTAKTTPVEAYQKLSPDFNGDSAYFFVDKQVAFGPRVPNTAQHIACGDYLVSELKRFGADVQEQKMVVTAYDGTKLNARNIIGSYNLDKKNRVLLFAHWDTRPYSDQDQNPANHHKPLLGANDGGSGVGVLLEVARIIQSKSPEVGIDIIFFDAEDYGVPAFKKDYPDPTNATWCLGSQYWAKNPHVPNYKAKYGILLDMVGADGAKFYREGYSKEYARNVLDRVWSTAVQLGYGNYFINKDGGVTTDDHVPVNEVRRIPSIDIIQFDENSDTSFYHAWHTQKDDMSGISKETLKAVGQTVLEVIYKEK
ncbi:M28 family peptidase [Dysgonomonas sp. Marseille-P4677]|uniref:M28 family peptidase n=1 Tax=Dysgonomonas sp. Marseille-P4677 TaxID=2364790 RepID=UPI0019144FB4|nr:M28 family peptidase [Dysgonomonas sp. Marseille-P4677]MBK5722617.1 M28 family peptidase [Dysgonomonas sp. Marseille-P4677]